MPEPTTAPVTAEDLRERIAPTPGATHQPATHEDYPNERPSCIECGERWPCEVQRLRDVLAAGDPGDLPARMAEAMHAVDCGCEDGPDEWHRRFATAAVPVAQEHAVRKAAEVERLRAELAEASDALRAVGKAALVVAPALAKPYPDAPNTSPWQQFMERPVRDAYNLGKRIRRDLKEVRDA